MLLFTDKPYELVDEGNQQTLQFMRDDRVVLNCTFMAYPIPNEVQWYGPENNQLPPVHIVTTINGPNVIRSELTFDRISIVEQGIYRCVARNEYGTAEHSYQLIVQMKTTINRMAVSSRETIPSTTGI